MPTMKVNMKIVSYGGGTNSTAMLVGLYERGERPDAITFADTGGEKPHTYEHIAEMQKWCLKVGFPQIEILKGAMRQQIIDGSLEQECLRLGSLPSKAYGFSSCSMKWKVDPQRRYVKEFSSKHSVELGQITRLIGFDADEHIRVERGRNATKNEEAKQEYPLYDWGWGREECVEAIARAGLQQPGKSACFFCPSSKKHEIIELRERYPELLQRALEMERRALAGEGQAPKTTGAGLGRSFGWGAWLRMVDDAAAHDADLVTRQIKLFCDAGVPEMDCGCYDG